MKARIIHPHLRASRMARRARVRFERRRGSTAHTANHDRLWRWLTGCAFRAAAGDLHEDGAEIWVAGAELAGDEIAAARGDLFAVDKHVKLTCVTSCADGIDAEAFFDECRETRDLRVVVVSRGAMNDFDFQRNLLGRDGWRRRAAVYLLRHRSHR